MTGELNTNIRELHIQSHDGIFEGRVSLYVKNIQDLKVIMEKVGKIRGIEKVNRVENNQEQRAMETLITLIIVVVAALLSKKKKDRGRLCPRRR